MIKDVLWIIIISGSFIQLAIVKICNTIYNIYNMKYMSENSSLIFSQLNGKERNKILSKIEEGENKNDNQKL